MIIPNRPFFFFKKKPVFYKQQIFEDFDFEVDFDDLD